VEVGVHRDELVGTVQRLSLARSLEEIQEIVRDGARRLTGADGAAFVIRTGDSCYYADVEAIAPLWKGRSLPLRGCVAGWAMLNRRPAAIEDIHADERIPQDAERPDVVRSIAVVPIRQHDPVGAITSYWASRHRATPDELGVLQALADSTAVAMENVRVNRELEDSRLETLQRLALAAEYRDDGTRQHTERVARTSFALAEHLGLPADQASLIYRAAPLHDVGKLAVPESILLKPGRLTPDEFAQVKSHTTTGGAILAGSSSEILRTAEEIALTHHEWWNGHGYPAGLAGEDIPLCGRIVAVADVFDALTHERPYKDAWPIDQAVDEIRSLRSSQFDPDIVAVFMELDPDTLVDLPGHAPAVAVSASNGAHLNGAQRYAARKPSRQLG
jgi:response regulator RpfG family c-di-GMP phosphodiesterase